MKVVWQGREYSWNIIDTPRENCSRLHKKVRELLRQVFPFDVKCEEVTLPGIRLFADFVLPSRKLIVEVQGEQHYRFNPHFHGHKLNFWKSGDRDRTKSDWCEVNGFRLVALKYDEEELWANQLKNA